jgi:hypothetical protein
MPLTAESCLMIVDLCEKLKVPKIIELQKTIGAIQMNNSSRTPPVVYSFVRTGARYQRRQEARVQKNSTPQRSAVTSTHIVVCTGVVGLLLCLQWWVMRR